MNRKPGRIADSNRYSLGFFSLCYMKMEIPMQEDRFVRTKEIQRITGLTRQTIWRMEKLQHFPKRRKLTNGHAVGWSLREVLEWMESRERVAA